MQYQRILFLPQGNFAKINNIYYRKHKKRFIKLTDREKENIIDAHDCKGSKGSK